MIVIVVASILSILLSTTREGVKADMCETDNVYLPRVAVTDAFLLAQQYQVNPFSIQSNVSKYAEPQGTQTPEISEIVGGIQFSTDEQKKEAIEEAVKDAEDAAKKL